MENILENRIKDLEIKFSHQDDLIEQLNQIVTNQQFSIERLEKVALELKLAQGDNASQSSRTLADDVPPHY